MARRVAQRCKCTWCHWMAQVKNVSCYVNSTIDKKQKLKTERIIWKNFNHWKNKWRKGVLFSLVTKCYIHPIHISHTFGLFFKNCYLHTIDNDNSKSLTHLPQEYVCIHINVCFTYIETECVCTICAMLLSIDGCIYPAGQKSYEGKVNALGPLSIIQDLPYHAWVPWKF